MLSFLERAGASQVSYPVLVFTQQPLNIVAGQSFDPVITVEFQTKSGDTFIKADYPVTLSIFSGTGALIGTTTKNAVAGVVDFTGISMQTANDFVLQVSTTQGGIKPAQSDPFTVSPDVPSVLTSELIRLDNNQKVDTGAINFMAVIKDQYNNLVPNVAVNFSTNHHGSMNPYTPTTNEFGQAITYKTSPHYGSCNVWAKIGGVDIQNSPRSAFFTFTPVDLFDNGAGGVYDGVLYDCKLSEHRQTNAGSALAPAGSATGWAEDISGNNRPWYQNSSGYRPIWNTSNGLHGFNKLMNGTTFPVMNRNSDDYSVWTVGWNHGDGGSISHDLIGGWLGYRLDGKFGVFVITNSDYAHLIGCTSYWANNNPQAAHYALGAFHNTSGNNFDVRWWVQKTTYFTTNAIFNARRFMGYELGGGSGGYKMNLIPSLGVHGTFARHADHACHVDRINIFYQSLHFPNDTRNRNRDGYVQQTGAIRRTLTQHEWTNLNNYAVANHGALGGHLESV
jgi:hypothetical protein